MKICIVTHSIKCHYGECRHAESRSTYAIFDLKKQKLNLVPFDVLGSSSGGCLNGQVPDILGEDVDEAGSVLESVRRYKTFFPRH